MTMLSSALEGFRPMKVSPAQILLHLTISNRCGQSFRWHERKVGSADLDAPVEAGPRLSEWSFCLRDRVVVLKQDVQSGLLLHKTLLPGDRRPSESVESETESWIRDYLNLNVDLEQKYQEWSGKDAVFADLAGRFSGIRMLRQPVFECLVS